MEGMSDPLTEDPVLEAGRKAVGSVSVRAMRLRSFVALALLATLSIGSYLLVRRSLAEQESAATVLRISSRQRFLAERMIVSSVRLLNHFEAAATRQKLVQLEQDAAELERSHDALMSGEATSAIGGAISPEIMEIYSKPPVYLDRTIRTFLDLARRLIRASSEEETLEWVQPQMDYIQTISSTPILEDLSNGLDTLVQQFQKESDDRMRSTRRLEFAVLATTILVLFAVGMFVFRPMIVRVREDIEELQRAGAALRERAEALERSNAELEQFAYVASHDLQEPLRMIAAYVQLLERRYKGKLGSDADECIHFASEGATRMHRLILDLLAYSRVGTHGGGMVTTDLGHALQGVLDDMQVAIEETGARIHSNGLPHLRGDPQQIGQLLQNLVANAIKFRGATRPEIRIESSREGDTWHVSVRDNGIGFDMRFAERIFVIFQRLHARDRYPGTGIGLAICKKIVERHGGRIWAESKPGDGSTFHFTLPARD
jgi:signal transduction histidine kinase